MAKKILITGAGSGLGKGCALGLAAEGHQVIAAVELWSQVTLLRSEAQAAGLNTMNVIKLDVCDESDRAYVESFDIDILVNNAGIGETGPIAEIPPERIRKVFEVNVFGSLAMAQLFAKKFVNRGSGKIVFVSSMAGVSTYPYLGPYNASKHALEAIAQCMANELKEFGVQVCTINPGAYRTGFNDRMYETFEHWYNPTRNFTPEKPLRDIQAAIAAPVGQEDPQAMIDLMVKTIPAEHHKFRTMIPASVEQWCKEYQARLWVDEI
ncbi:SDR family oxidoreductase [Crenobacter intestini]|uniref:SDR family oxidoreductase n=1 Tax=Crenobacter intestini TaxID=2563443 RepID=A0A4T0UVG0_9NEIS|nr:SDR family oxidoreductase [Crenobacter intestini]TIC83049.1 SDR family oxidoreductase [Crenobacter intestini]